MRFRPAGLALTATLVVFFTLLAAEAQPAKELRHVALLFPGVGAQDNQLHGLTIPQSLLQRADQVIE